MTKQENQKIVIELSENDLSDLLNGESFEWTFPDQNNKWIDVSMSKED